ncbi:MAG: nucleoside deaminase [Pseudomonadota bacterium]
MNKPLMTQPKEDFMSAALVQAELAAHRGEIPVGAVIVCTDQVVSAFGNEILEQHDPTAHAEILAIRKAAQKMNMVRLTECDLYVTLEPCPMCAQAISLARIRRLYFGAYDPKGGGVDHGPQIFNHKTCHHKPEVVGGIQEKECAAILQTFFESRRIY